MSPWLKRIILALVLGAFAWASAYGQTPHHHRSAHHKARAETDFDCAVHTAYGEAKGLGKVEAAVIINGLVKRAHEEGHSVCVEARERYKPRRGSTPDIVAAANNVFSHKASWVPARFRNATDFRAAHAPRPKDDKLVRIGQLSRRGNVFYMRRPDSNDTADRR